jgi:hypothetical protein
MMQKSRRRVRATELQRLRRRLHVYVDRALGGAALIAVHETAALHGHWSELSERVRLARKALGARALIREQVDLLPESRTRLQRDQEVRRQLWRGLLKDLAAPVQQRAARR